MRIIFAVLAVFLLSVVGLQLAGGLLLMYVVWKIYREIRMASTHDIADPGLTVLSLRAAIVSIIIADISMSLDNVLAVAGASHGNIVVLGIGLVVSIFLMAVASNYMAVLLKKYPQVQWIGLLILLYVALHMIYVGGQELLPFVGF